MSIHLGAFVVLALSYSYSGYTKLLSPGWVSGSAIAEVLHNPLARQNWLTSLMLALPPVALKGLTWTVLAVELLFAPLCLWARARRWLWLAMLLVQFGFLICLDFADLTLPMLLAHLLTFNPRWLEHRVDRRPALLLFDGQCAFCHASVHFAAMEDSHGMLRFATLDGAHGLALTSNQRQALGDTIVLIDAYGQQHARAAAVAGILKRLGGLWWLLGSLLGAIPRPIADGGYDLIGRIRYRLAGRLAEDSCPWVPAQIASRMLR